MEEEKKQLLMEQINKLAEVIETLSNDFADNTEEEVNFLDIVKKNLTELVK